MIPQIIIIVPVPGEPTVTALSSIFLSWSVPSGSVVTSSEVTWEAVDTDNGSISGSVTTTSTNFTIPVECSGTYYLTVTLINDAGPSSDSKTIIFNCTTEAGPSNDRQTIIFNGTSKSYITTENTNSCQTTTVAAVSGGATFLVVIIIVVTVILFLKYQRREKYVVSIYTYSSYVLLMCVCMSWMEMCKLYMWLYQD